MAGKDTCPYIEVSDMKANLMKMGLLKSCVLLLALFGLAGCGRKGFPVPAIVEEESPKIDKVFVNLYPDGVELSWYVPTKDKSFSKYPYCFTVEKAEIDWKGLSCKECPDLPWQKTQCFHPAYPDPAKIEDGKMVWKDSRIVVNRAYRYRVTVSDRDRQRVITASDPVDVRIYPIGDMMKRLTARSTDKGIIVEWLICPDQCKDAKNTLSFKVEKRSGSEPWRVVSEANYRKTNYLDTEVEGGKLYDYRVTPYYEKDGITIWGKPYMITKVKAKTRVLPPPPESIWVVPGKEGLEVHWLEPKGGKIAGYNVYRKQPDGSIVRLNDKPVPHSPFIDKTALPNQVYGYAVSSVSSDPSGGEGVTSSWIEIRNVFTKDKEKEKK